MTNDLDRRFLLGGLAGAAGVSALSAMAKGGPLNPPAGPIISTGKTITEAAPRTAVTPAMANPPGSSTVYTLPAGGNYYLTSDITVPNSPSGIGVFLNQRCTLDLNGFSIIGAGGGAGIRTAAGCTVRNGTIRGTAGGILYYFAEDTDILVEDMRIEGTSYRGVLVPLRSIVRRCRLLNCSPVGIECVNDHGQVEDCTVAGSSGTGVYLNAYSRLRNCAITALTAGAGSPSAGGGGAYVGPGSVVEHCVFNGCSGSGLQVGARSLVTDCSAMATVAAPAGLPGIGFEINDGAEIARCAAPQNVIGFRCFNAVRIADCGADGNSSAGIRIVGNATIVEGCRLARNAVGVDLRGFTGNCVYKCVLMANTTAIATDIGGNFYPNVTLANANTATNPLVNLVI